MNSNKRRMSPYQDPHAFYMLIFQSRSGSFLKNENHSSLPRNLMFSTGKVQFFQTTICYIINITKQGTKLFTAIF